VRGSDSDASMTAFSLIAIQEARPICEEMVNVSSTFFTFLPPYLFVLVLTSYLLYASHIIKEEK
jgi:hypothetical protein